MGSPLRKSLQRGRGRSGLSLTFCGAGPVESGEMRPTSNMAPIGHELPVAHSSSHGLFGLNDTLPSTGPFKEGLLNN